jgi:hypothetical protein
MCKLIYIALAMCTFTSLCENNIVCDSECFHLDEASLLLCPNLGNKITKNEYRVMPDKISKADLEAITVPTEFFNADGRVDRLQSWLIQRQSLGK